MLGVGVAGVGVGVVLGAAVAGGDDHFMACGGLDVVQDVDQDGVDELLGVFCGKAVLLGAAAIGDLALGGIGAAASAAEVLFGDGFYAAPGVDGGGCGGGGG